MHREPSPLALLAAGSATTVVGLLGQWEYPDGVMRALSVIASVAGLVMLALLFPEPPQRFGQRRRWR